MLPTLNQGIQTGDWIKSSCRDVLFRSTGILVQWLMCPNQCVCVCNQCVCVCLSFGILFRKHGSMKVHKSFCCVLYSVNRFSVSYFTHVAEVSSYNVSVLQFSPKTRHMSRLYMSHRKYTSRCNSPKWPMAVNMCVEGHISVAMDPLVIKRQLCLIPPH